MKLVAALTVVCFPAFTQVQVTQTEGRIEVAVNGQPFTTFYIGPETTKPYLHPLRSASGKIVTRRYPMENVDGEARDHVHHQGLWFTHGDVNGVDFWANHPTQAAAQKGPPKGRVVLRRVDAVKSGPLQGTIRATFEWLDPAGKTLLREQRTMLFHAHRAQRQVDFDIRLAAIEKARFGDTKEGTFAIRLATSLEEKHTGKMISAEGNVGESKVWGTRSPWVDYSGVLDGEKLGVTIMDHPGNPRHPTYWHSRAYGLFAANVFGEHDFLRDKTRDGSMTLEAGQAWRFRYRVVIHPGDTTTAPLAAEYRQYAQPASN